MKRTSNELYTRQKAFAEMKFFMGLLPDPDPILRAKGKDFSVYQELLFDSHVDACITSREAGVLSSEWQIVVPSSRRVDKKAFDFVRENFSVLDIETLIRNILDAIYFGYAVLEKIYATDGNQIFLEEIIEKPQKWFGFNEDRQLIFKTGASEYEKVDMSRVELIQYKPTYTNPYGERKLAKVFWPVSIKKGGIKFWLDFAEKFGSVFLLAKTNHEGKREDLLRMLEEMIQNAVGVFETGDEIIQLNVEKSGASNLYKELLEFCNAEISKSILGQTLTTEEGRTGTFAQAKVHFEIRKDILEHDKKFVARYINSIIKKLVDLNFTVENYPEFVFFEEDNLDIDTVVKLRQIGLNFNKNFYIDKFRISEEYFDLGNSQSNETSFSEYNFAEEDASEYKEIIEEEKNIQDFYNKTKNDFQKAFEPFLNELQNAIENSENYDEAIANVLKTLGKKRDYDILGQLLLSVDLLTRNQLQKTYDFADRFIEKELNYLKMKVPLTKEDFNKLQDKYKNLGFTVAGYAEEDKVAEILNEFISAKEKGLSFKELKENLKKKGLEISEMVYYQNIKNMQMAAKYDMLYRNRDEYPYWQYVAILDGKTRPAHLALHGKIFRADDPFWNTAFPPNGFNCRCNVKPLSSDDVKGMKIENGGSIFFQPDKGFANNPGETLNWVKQKQEEAYAGLKDIKLIKEPTIDLKGKIRTFIEPDESTLIDIQADISRFNDVNYKNKLIDEIIEKYNIPKGYIDIVDYRGKTIKVNYKNIIIHAFKKIKDEKSFREALERVKYLKLIPEFIKNPDIVVGNIYATKNKKTKVSMNYIKKIKDKEKEFFFAFSANFDRENPDYIGATFFNLKLNKTTGFIIKPEELAR